MEQLNININTEAQTVSSSQTGDGTINKQDIEKYIDDYLARKQKKAEKGSEADKMSWNDETRDAFKAAAKKKKEFMEKMLGGTMGVMAYEAVKDVAENVLETTAGNVGLSTSNQALQNRTDNVVNTVKKGASFATSVGAGAMVGGAVGAAIAAVAWTANQAISIANNSYKAAVENSNRADQNARDSSRLGIIETGRGR